MMQKNNRKIRKIAKWEPFIIGAMLIILLWLSVSSSEGSESHKTIIQGYEGSERISTVEKPVKGKPDTSRKTGWVGDRRIDLTVVRTPKHTVTKGWEGDTYINVKERKDD